MSPIAALTRWIENNLLTERRLVWLARLALTGGMRQRMYEQLSAQIENGRALRTAMEDISARAERRYGRSNPVAVMTMDIAYQLRGGDAFAQALAQWAPRDEVLPIDAGEQAGDLPTALRAAITSRERARAMKSAVSVAMIEPVVLSISLYALLIFVGLYVVPPLTNTIPPERWTGTARGLYWSAQFATSIWMAVMPLLIVVAIVAVRYSLPRWTGRARTRFDRFPPWSLYRTLRGSALLTSIAALMQSGVSDTEAVTLMSKHANPWLRERLDAVRVRMIGGKSLGSAMEESGYEFPDRDMIDDILAYQGYPDFSRKISVLADQWAEKGKKRAVSAAKVMNMVINLLVYGLMIYIVLGINALQIQIGGSMGGM